MRHGLRSLLSVLTLGAILSSSSWLAAQDGLPGGFPIPCGLDCFPKAFEAAKACKEGGGDFIECSKVFAEALTTCREEAGCETPERPPICGEDCLKAARAAAAACREAGGDVTACFLELKDQLKSCLEAAGCELPEPPDGLPRCGVGCLKDAFGAARECIKGGGSFRDCVGAFRDALEACRAAEDCSGGDEPPADDEVDGEVLALALEDVFTRGDANGDLEIDISDPITVLRFLFQGTASAPCVDAADASDDGVLNITDPILLLSVLFQAAAPLPAPYPEPGLDPTDDAHVCGVTGS